MRSAYLVVAIAILLAGAGVFLVRPDGPSNAPSRVIVVVRAGDYAPTATPRAQRVDATPPARPTAIRSTPEPEVSAWAITSEVLLRAQMRQVPMLDVADNLEISCAAARCHAEARLPAGLEGDNRALYWRFIQGPAVRERMAELGLPLDRAELGSDDRFVLHFAKGA